MDSIHIEEPISLIEAILLAFSLIETEKDSENND